MSQLRSQKTAFRKNLLHRYIMGKIFNAGFEFHHLSLHLWIQILLHPHHCCPTNNENNVKKQLTDSNQNRAAQNKITIIIH